MAADQPKTVAVPVHGEVDQDEMKRSTPVNNTTGLEGEDDDADYLSTHSHPRAHPHEKEPQEGAFRVLYALEGGDPDAEVDVTHEAPGAKVGGWLCGFGGGGGAAAAGVWIGSGGGGRLIFVPPS